MGVSIYRAVVARTKLTTRQLETQAHALSYRAQQLAYVALLQSRGVVGRIDDAFVRGVIRNALIESALSHARALAYFLSGSPHDIDMHFSDFNSDWVDAVSEQTGRIIGLVSEHLAHSQPGDRRESRIQARGLCQSLRLFSSARSHLLSMHGELSREQTPGGSPPILARRTDAFRPLTCLPLLRP